MFELDDCGFGSCLGFQSLKNSPDRAAVSSTRGDIYSSPGCWCYCASGMCCCSAAVVVTPPSVVPPPTGSEDLMVSRCEK